VGAKLARDSFIGNTFNTEVNPSRASFAPTGQKQQATSKKQKATSNSNSAQTGTDL
jgi:hypothetical protein